MTYLTRLVLFSMILLSACAPQTQTTAVVQFPDVTVQALPGGPTLPSFAATATAAASPLAPGSPTGTPAPKMLTVCMPYEPDSLYEYANSGSRENILARAAVLEALRDGPIDHRTYDYQPIILQKLPGLADGDAALAAVTVRDGEQIVDSTGRLTTLTNGLRYFDPSGAEQVYDANAGPVQALQMTVTFKLLPGLKWEDGAPLTTDDVLFAWEVLKSPDNQASNHFLTTRADDPTVVDDQTIRWTYLPGFKDTLFYTRFPSPLPRHAYGALTPAQMAADENVNRRPLSYGAFKMSEWAAGDHITLTRNPYYFRASEGLPYLDTLTYRFVADGGQMLAQLNSGACDVGIGTQGGAQTSIFDSQISALRQAQTQGTLAAQFAPGSTFEHLDFNISPAAGYGGIVGGGLFQDVRVRQAFAYCINREALVESLMYGRPEAKALPVYVPADHPLYDATDIATYEFDPDKGRALLNEAGWADGNGDGVLDKGGKKLGLIYNHGPTGNTLRQSLAQLLKTQLKEDCGIDLTPQELKRDDLFGSFPDGALFGRRFDLGQFAWVADGEPSCLLYTSREWTGAGDGKEDKYGITSGATEGANDVGYFNPAFDAACYKALEALDPDDRKYWHHEAMKIFSQDVPSLVLFVRLRIAVARPSVTGFVLDSTQDSELWNVEAMDVLTP